MSLPDVPWLFWKHRVYPASIVHVGGHRGGEAEFYSRYCDGEVLWIEALPKLHASLVKNIAKYPRQEAICALVSDVDGEEIEFKVASNDGQSSSMLELGSHVQQHPDVKVIGSIALKTVTMDTLLLGRGMAFINALLVMDVQGAELKVLKGLREWINCFEWIICEVNRDETYKNCPRVEEIDEFLAHVGDEFHAPFWRVETGWFSPNHSWGDALYSRRAARLVGSP